MDRSSTSVATLALTAVIALLPAPQAFAQSGFAAVENAAARLAPKTPDGAPDLQGIYTNVSLTPLQRRKQLAGQAFFTPAEDVLYGAYRRHAAP